MIEAETGVVLFACSGVEPREGQTLVVVGSSSELGGWDASRGITLHRVKNPAFPGVWMSFPMCHSACSEVRFQFALVGPVADTLQSMTSDNGGLVVDGVKTSSAVSSALSAAPIDGRNQDCCGCVCEPLGCGPREVEVVGGGHALFGGRWGNGETRVTPLRLEDMVLAQQQLEQEYPASVSSELDSERDREGGRGEIRREGNFGGPAADDLIVDETSLSAASVVRSVTGQSQTAFTPRRSTVTERQGGCVGVASADFPSRSSVSDSRYPYPPAVKGGRMGHKKFDDDAIEAAAFSSDSVNGEREWGGQRGVGLWRGQTEEESVSDLTGFGQSVTGEHSSEGQWGSSVCEGPKRRRLSSVSIAVPESDAERRGGEEGNPMLTERNVVAYPFASVPLQDCSSPHYSRPSCATAIHSFGLQNGGISCQQKAVCGYPEEGGMERRMAKEGGKGLSEQGRVTKQVHPPRLSGVECNSGCVGVKRGEKKREHTGEVKRNRHGNILCPHHRKRNLCKECGAKSICEHGRIRSRCKECGGKSVCEHSRRRYECKECGGKSFCEHGRIRYQCKECGGKSICEHGRIRYQCKECGGKGICEHGRRRSQCKECRWKSICEHGRQRYFCKDCGGAGHL
uniref:CBM20 domain-containing protein n=1 Tax=Chromera velia CCMP2878 TaxID=1169474 RepID=A0A0G4F9N6_9ALVE|eukprot:Cvel_15792.t1-p1 / transcript=Cvel_15792.t1 / gene=Cvel_15792 / organism=Chromera_velia_CCMP2878 / gene_product=Zinc finger protein 345, putative / transcript_product=Zinc finger protein 345, putative / location=Cvel_scaffold1185:29262-31136(+) / protein_length=625 / sequence_SO=supercontig / SO=protein_coding / is_pseudo=false